MSVPTELRHGFQRNKKPPDLWDFRTRELLEWGFELTDMTSILEISDEPVTLWMRQLEEGQSEAAQPLWEHFCKKLMSLAEKRLSPKLRRTYDHEDAAVSAFHSLCRVITDRRPSDLSDRVNLWRLLVTITERKITNRVRDEQREKRDIRQTLSESCLINASQNGSGFDNLPSREPSPEFAAEFADLCESLLDSLEDKVLREVAQLTLQNYDTTEVAQKLGVTRRTVERKLLIIRSRWQQRMAGTVPQMT
jgi:RNA polymerase sigma factor (sigma-70 family)